MTKPWSPAEVAAQVLKGHLGVYQLADADEKVILIAFAGGKSLYGLKGEVTAALEAHPEAKYFRHEITTAYQSRWRELMMVHIADHGEPPPCNPPVKLGKLSPA
ncbi:MAG: hypothetical protein AAF513_17880 [Pseudomonadota bacterium]